MFNRLFNANEGRYCTQPSENTETLQDHNEYYKLIFNESQLIKLNKKLKTYNLKLILKNLRGICGYFISCYKEDITPILIFDLDIEGVDIFEKNNDNSYKYINLSLLKVN